jgi:hypothetical protein
VRLAELEGQPQQASQAPEQAQQAMASDLGKRVSELTKQVEELSQREIWLPPQATPPPTRPVAARPMPPAQARPATPPRQSVRPPAPMPRTFHLSRTMRFVLEAMFIIAVAVIVWLADLPTPAIAVAMGIAWTLVAVVEWVTSERPGRR